MSRMILLFLMMTCLEACNEQETDIEIPQQEIILPKPVDIAGKLYLEVDAIECSERNYRISQPFLGPTEKFHRVDLNHCHKMFGYRPASYVRQFNLMEYVRKNITTAIVEDANQKALEIMGPK